jgi:putative Mn2+ efflux pump MntP
MDAFAVALCLGLSMEKVTFKKSLIVGLYFGFFQAIMSLIGYYAATLFAKYITAFDHWIAFALLLILGVKMIYEAFEKDKEEEKETVEPSLGPKKMLPFALATSIDALAVGVSFAMTGVHIFTAIGLIGGITLALSMVAVVIGKVIGSKFKSAAEIVGGVILILIGVKILLNHLGVINF